MLGIIFNKKGIDKTNLENCKSKIEKTLIMWNGIRFNIIDKITVLRTFGFSKLWYLLNFICLNEKEIKDFETIAFKYIWGGKVELISRNLLYSDFKKGGLNMICLRAKISMISIRNLMYIKYSMARPQYQYSLYLMKFYFKEYLVNSNIIPGGLDKDRPEEYNLMINCFNCFNNADAF